MPLPLVNSQVRSCGDDLRGGLGAGLGGGLHAQLDVVLDGGLRDGLAERLAGGCSAVNVTLGLVVLHGGVVPAEGRLDLALADEAAAASMVSALPRWRSRWRRCQYGGCLAAILMMRCIFEPCPL